MHVIRIYSRLSLSFQFRQIDGRKIPLTGQCPDPLLEAPQASTIPIPNPLTEITEYWNTVITQWRTDSRSALGTYRTCIICTVSASKVRDYEYLGSVSFLQPSKQSSQLQSTSYPSCVPHTVLSYSVWF